MRPPLESADLEFCIGFLRGGARPPLQVTCSFIDEHKNGFGLEPICTTLREAREAREARFQIAPSAYYARQQRGTPARERRDEVLKEEIAQVHHEDLRVFGARKVHIMLNREEDRLG